MFFDTNKLFTIGQFAKLHEINKKTLMWYDKVGILKPAVIKPNGYRYYTYQQSSLLETILMLRELNVSISEIQHFLNNRCAFSLESLLTDKITELDNTISHLKAIRAVMNEKKQNMTHIRTLDMSGFEIVEKTKAHYFVTVPTTTVTSFEKEIEMVVDETKSINYIVYMTLPMELCYPSKIYTMAISMTIPFCILNYQNQRINRDFTYSPRGNI